MNYAEIIILIVATRKESCGNKSATFQGARKAEPKREAMANNHVKTGIQERRLAVQHHWANQKLIRRAAWIYRKLAP
jgi:hypothetical protein